MTSIGATPVDYIVHKKVDVAGSTALPTQLEYGEIGVNYSDTGPSLMIRTDADRIHEFKLPTGPGGLPIQPPGTMQHQGPISLVTDPPPTAPREGDLFLNTAKGVPGAAWGFPPTVEALPGQALLWDGTRWQLMGPTSSGLDPGTAPGQLLQWNDATGDWEADDTIDGTATTVVLDHSMTAGVKPAALEPGELYVNAADGEILAAKTTGGTPEVIANKSVWVDTTADMATNGGVRAELPAGDALLKGATAAEDIQIGRSTAARNSPATPTADRQQGHGRQAEHA